MSNFRIRPRTMVPEVLTASLVAAGVVYFTKTAAAMCAGSAVAAT